MTVTAAAVAGVDVSYEPGSPLLGAGRALGPRRDPAGWPGEWPAG